MRRVLVPLADGFEEIEGITIIDVLRRADIEVVTASLHDGPVEASRKTRHLADTTLDAVGDESFDMIVLPGGTTGVLNLQNDTRLQDVLKRHHSQGRLIGAICAAPNLLRNNQILKGQDRFTAFPASLTLGEGGHYTEDRVVRSGTVTTSTSAGSAFEFALDLVEQLCGKHVRDRVHDALYLPF
jgi:4-methyl-5(b-hydroxyethyl)-thiazole monophosphate biosynthesis